MDHRAVSILVTGLLAAPVPAHHGVHVTESFVPIVPAGTHETTGPPMVATSLADILEGTPLPEGTPLVATPIARTGEFSASLVQARGSLPPHFHAVHDEFVVVTGGEGAMRVGDELFPAVQGSIFFMPRGTIHAFTSKGDGVATVVSVFGPAFDGKDRIFLDQAVEITGETKQAP